jgi:hypothetical protein
MAHPTWNPSSGRSTSEPKPRPRAHAASRAQPFGDRRPGALCDRLTSVWGAQSRFRRRSCIHGHDDPRASRTRNDAQQCSARSHLTNYRARWPNRTRVGQLTAQETQIARLGGTGIRTRRLAQLFISPVYMGYPSTRASPSQQPRRAPNTNSREPIFPPCACSQTRFRTASRDSRRHPGAALVPWLGARLGCPLRRSTQPSCDGAPCQRTLCIGVAS